MYDSEAIIKRAKKIKVRWGTTYAIGIVCIAIKEGDVSPLQGRGIIVREILGFKEEKGRSF